MNHKNIKFLFTLVIAIALFIPFYSTTSAQTIPPKPPLKIVQLGDSYSAGNGARSAAGAEIYTGVEGCHRSPANWGSQYAESLKGTYAVTYINRACSGGVISDITNPRNMDDFPILRNILDGSCPALKYPEEEYYDPNNAIFCDRLLRPQIDAIDNSVDLVILTMGGNDVKFDNIVKYCFVTGFRNLSDCKSYVDQAGTDLVRVEQNLVNAFTALRSSDKLKPDAKIVLVTYPYLIPDMAFKFDAWGWWGPIPVIVGSYDTAGQIRALGLEGDNRQRAAVETVNRNASQSTFLFEGTKAVFAGHEPSPYLLNRNPDRWIYEAFDSWNLWEWYHPNSTGHYQWASALSAYGDFGAGGVTPGSKTDVDVAFVVDTTGSMYDDIAQVRADLSRLVDQLAATTASYRIALVTYRDFPERTGWSGDYPFRVNQTFTGDLGTIQSAINSLTANGGGDWQETIFSGVKAALELPWRPGVTKIAIVLGDAPALSPEPYTNLTAAQIVAQSLAIDPVQVVGVDTGDLDANGALGEIAAGTGGAVIQGSTGLTTKIAEVLDQAAKKPFAWLGEAYAGKIGQPVQFDGSGSFDPSGTPISLYEWDFNGDSVFDLQSQDATATHTYDAAYSGLVVLRVTGAGGTALATARIEVNLEGSAPQGDQEPCALDENGYSITVDAEGRAIACKAENLPEQDQPDVYINTYTPPTLGIVDDQSIQYSDPLSFVVSASDPNSPPASLAFSASGLPADMALTNNIDGTATISGIANVAPGTYTLQITVTDPDGLTDTKPVNIVVTQEDARTTYTGPMMVSTSGISVTTATVPLRATIQDITAVDPTGDPNPGEIMNASVTFINRESNAILCTAQLVLLDPNDRKKASAACDWTADLGNSDGANYSVGVVVGGYYLRNTTMEDTVVVVSRPVTNFITGGGYLTNQSSGGKYAGDSGAMTNFGINLKFNKKLTNLQGQVTMIVRQNGHVYLVKSNNFTSLVASLDAGRAELLTKANLQDITDPSNPISLEGGATLQVVMQDNGEPGASDTLEISVWDKGGGLLFSSSWTGTKTIPQLLGGGNIQVH